MVYKVEFRRRLLRLQKALNRALVSDCYSCSDDPNDLFPALFSVLSYLISSSDFKIFK